MSFLLLWQRFLATATVTWCSYASGKNNNLILILLLNLPQCVGLSSLISPQSLSPSHRYERGMQMLVDWHFVCSGWQVLSAEMIANAHLMQKQLPVLSSMWHTKDTHGSFVHQRCHCRSSCWYHCKHSPLQYSVRCYKQTLCLGHKVWTDSPLHRYCPCSHHNGRSGSGRARIAHCHK